MLVSAAIDPYRKSYGNSRKQLGDRRRQQRERSHDRFAEEDVRPRRPGVRDCRRDDDANSERNARAVAAAQPRLRVTA